ncbi:Transposon Tn7 transposition protein tnsA [Candidatus Burkholderia humilis]|nr:Transposon Tn7 transposition protein tnsA [Candidatus Burkholderia humilis]
MARGIRNWTEKLIAQRIREGYGEGEGAAYKPWIRTADFSSLGRTTRMYSAKFARTLELVSDVEIRTFLMLEWANDITQVYEQLPLEREQILQIAAALGIRHPCYPGTTVPAVMTVDFLAVHGNLVDAKLQAFDCKRLEDAKDPTTREKLQITRAYFAGRDIAHRLVFSSKLPMQKVENIEWARGGVIKQDEINPTPSYLREKAASTTHELAHSTCTAALNEYCRTFDERHGLRSGFGMRLARHLIWEHTLVCDIDTPRLESAPLSSFRVAQSGELLLQASGA